MADKKLAIIAVGGNSLILDETKKTVQDQYAAIVETCRNIAGILEMGYRVVVTHGNGPQVGFILRRSELARSELHEVPLDSCGADTQGAIGYQIQQAMGNETKSWPHPPTVVTVVTRVLVDRDDPSFGKPSKPIGSFMSKELAFEHWEQIASHPVALGWRGIGKRRRGDGKTPLGRYDLGVPRPSRKYGTFIPVGYPTAEQRQRGFTGSAIGIHGPPRETRHAGLANVADDWTLGCIAVADDATIRAVAAWVRANPQAPILLE